MLTCLISCSNRAKVIPLKKLQKIYREMFFTDEWIKSSASLREKSDSMVVYEPIFNKYGYTTEDYLKSIDHYLKDPKKYEKSIKDLKTSLEKELTDLNSELLRDKELKDKILEYEKSASAIQNFVYTFREDLRKDTIAYQRDTFGVYKVVPIFRDAPKKYVMQVDSSLIR